MDKVETLIRWNHDLNGLILPQQFLPIAEESGLINKIGDWVFQNIFDFIESYDTLFSDDFKICINVSQRQLKNLDYETSWLKKLVTNIGLRNKIIIEITETTLNHNDSSIKRHINTLNQENISVALDDFGTGFSSLTHLRENPIDFIKIDKSFIQNITTDSNDRIICKSVISMVKELNMQVIAEGVETQEQYDLLKSIDCDYIQGYYFAKPMPASEFTNKWLNIKY